ncbi:hypothetical protein [Bacillus sp. T3]|uniref:hypothetical protein n=1 Tax=Bacillus sp. T3 TaxID=467262 RepID=UPI00298187AC|nr:hypothetical protein [Bacillus sp. T3]
MSVYENNSNKTKVHLSIPENPPSNQQVYHQHYMEEMLKSQERINQKLSQSIKSIGDLLETRNNDQQESNTAMTTRMEKHEINQMTILNNLTALEKTVLEKLANMNKEQQALIQLVDQEEILHQALLAQLTTQDQTTNRLMSKLKELEENLLAEINSQIQDSNRKLSSKIEVHDVYHQTVMERIDQQEAHTHKLNRQLDTLKSVIYERFSLLTEKIELQSKQMLKTFSGYFFKPSKRENDSTSHNQSNT